MSLEVVFEELDAVLEGGDAFGEGFGALVAHALYGDELVRDSGGIESGFQAFGLLNGHERVGVAVDGENGSAVFTDERDGAHLVDFSTSGFERLADDLLSDDAAEGGGEIVEEVGGTEDIEDALDPVGVLGGALGAEEEGEVSACTRSGGSDLGGGDAVLLVIGAEVGDGGSNVVDHDGPLVARSEAVADGGGGETVFGQLGGEAIHIGALAGDPGTAVNDDGEGGIGDAFGFEEIGLDFSFTVGAVDDIALNVESRELGNLGLCQREQEGYRHWLRV